MPYFKHPACSIPERLETKIWRYMDFPKFVSLLEEQSLFFSKLSLFDDPYEGYLPRLTKEQFLKIPDNTADKSKAQQIVNTNLALRDNFTRECLLVSCWHMSEYENIAMWKSYSIIGKGVAVQSTLKCLMKAFEGVDDLVNIGSVKYIDYYDDKIKWQNTFHSALCKRKQFDHEKEVRVLVVSPEGTPGKLIPVDLNILIEKVFVSPKIEHWILELIKKLLVRYGLSKEVVCSDLDRPPDY